MPPKSHKLVTYGRSSRNKPQGDALRLPESLDRSSRSEGDSTESVNRGPQQPKQVRQQNTKSSKTRTSSTRPDFSERSYPLDVSTGYFRPSIGDETEEESSVVERKRRKFVSGNEECRTHEAGNHGDSHNTVEVANRLSADRVGRSDNNQPRSEVRQNRSEKQPVKRTAVTRKKLVDFLDSVDSSNKEPPANDISDGGSNDVQYPPDITTVQNIDLPVQQLNSEPGESSSQDICSMEDSAAVLPSGGLRASRATYGRQRSFLNEASVRGHIEDENDSHHRKQQQIVHVSTPHVNFHADDDMGDGIGPVRSIHELRQAGDNARFQGAVDGIFEEIAASHGSASARCNGFVQLSLRLLDRRFSSRFCESGFVEKFVECLTNDLDVISASFALCSCELIHTSDTFSPTHWALLWPKLLDLSSILLDAENDIYHLSKRRIFGISKSVQISIQRTIPVLSSAIGGDLPLSTLSPCLIALRSIYSCLLAVRQNNDNIEPIKAATLKQLVNMVLLKNPGPLMSPEDFQVVRWVLSILEAYMTLSSSLSVDHQDALRPITRLYHLLDLDKSEFNDQSQEIRVLYIKVILNLTNNDSSFWTEFVKPELVRELVGIVLSNFCMLTDEPLVQEKSSMDTVILSLGTLINLTQRSELVRTMFLTTAKSSTPLLQLLLQQFSAANIDLVTEAKSVHDTHYNVIVGYLSVLLTTLCLKVEAYSQVNHFLGDKGLESVLSIAEEFQQYHQRVEQDLHEAGRITKSSFTTELQDIIREVHHLGESS